MTVTWRWRLPTARGLRVVWGDYGGPVSELRLTLSIDELHAALLDVLDLPESTANAVVARAVGESRQNYHHVRKGSRSITADLVARWCAEASRGRPRVLEMRIRDGVMSFVVLPRDTA